MSYPFITKFNYAAVRKEEINGRATVGRVFNEIAPNQVDFGFKDAKGREIGARAGLLELRFVEVEVPAHHYHCYVADKAITAELFYAVDVSAQRGGEDYGASQNYQLFATKAEAEAYIAKYLKDAAKRAAKREGK
jgi:hypothetical protein